MTDRQILTETKSPERVAFEHYIRTGRRLSPQGEPEVELKFNPYHDPRNGRFTFAPGGPRSLSDVIISDGHRGERRVSRSTAAAAAPEAPAASADSPQAGSLTDAVYRPDKTAPAIQPAQYRPNCRGRRGDNGGPSLNDPLTLDHVFPALRNSPGGSLIALADNIFDLTGPASRATTAVMENHINALIQQNKAINPDFRLAHRMAGFLASNAFAGPYLADQLLLPLALAGGGSFTTVKPSQHALTARDIIERFTGQRWVFEQQSNGCHLVRRKRDA